eukprot:TRINITY_DN3520_c0_g1_i2.p1 TRINITY_DN3520_c0_g1~~TRINITY_DN3520_c0_g1_i2.p1  ORF type:complete len:535 (+),score=143.33 TRINITY_DN3520_c0_g1_i2:333-1937(+)
MESVWSSIRGKISADKVRYNNGGYNLDLTYIGDRIIAMSFPAEGMESKYRNNVQHVSAMLNQYHPHAFMIYNLSQRSYDYKLFNNQVHEWCGFPDHHAPPLSLLFQTIKSIHSWLLADPLNVVVIHCLAGKGRTGLIIACYLVYSGLFEEVEKALAYFAAKRSSTNWGVTGPSQLRYAHYFNSILNKKKSPSFNRIKLCYIHLSHSPPFNSSISNYALGSPAGCTPIILIYEISDSASSPSESKKLVWTSEKEDNDNYPVGTSIHIPLNDTLVEGDILVEIYNMSPFYRREIMLKFQFNTFMLSSRSNVLRLNRYDLDHATSDKRFPSNFFLDLGMDVGKPTTTDNQIPSWWLMSPQGDGSINFWKKESLLEAKQLCTDSNALPEKGGWLTKRGHKVKNWKRRWFVLKDPNLSYYNKPRDTIPLGVIVLDDIQAVFTEDSLAEDDGLIDKNEKKPNYWFEIVTTKNSYLIHADSEEEMREWIESIEFVKNQKEQYENQLKKDTFSRSSQGKEDSFLKDDIEETDLYKIPKEVDH